MIPSPETLTSEWLTECLQKAGHDTEVVSFTQERVGTGQIGLCNRIVMETRGGPAPKSLIGKFPSPNALSRGTGVNMGTYLREVRFYREMQSLVSISTPRCYFADINGKGPEFLLLLADAAPAKQGDQIKGCDERVARAAVMELVGLQAPFWNQAVNERFDFIAPRPTVGGGGQERFLDLFGKFRERYAPRLSDDIFELIDRFGHGMQHLQARLAERPSAVVHYDYRLDNLLIDEAVEPPRISAVDWQTVTQGNPMTDVAYFLGGGLPPEERRRIEETLVREYHDGLCAAGIRDYSFDDCWYDYRLSVFFGFRVVVTASMIVQQTERGDEMFMTMARRHAAHAADLGSDEFLSS